MSEAPRLLLLSSSTVHPGGYLDHAEKEIFVFLTQAAKDVLFVPWALHDAAAYAARARERLARMGIGLRSLHDSADPGGAIAAAPAFFVGGGNTFRLLRALADRRLLEPLARRVSEGAPYVGSSAGTNIAAPTIRTTNDMPIVFPSSLEALALVPFQINPHYLDGDPQSTHRGETREERIAQFHEEPENQVPVVGLREGAILRREGANLRLLGSQRARVFFPDGRRREFEPGADLSELLERRRSRD